MPATLKSALGLSDKDESQLIVAGAYNKIELWPAEKYQERIQNFLMGSESEKEMTELFEEAFSAGEHQVKKEWSHELEV